jgi:predicted O-methyltransferase YrrM
MGNYRAITQIPELVEQALEVAALTNFSASCSPQVGRLLRVLASHIQRGTLAEIGTGCGVGSAWIVSGLTPSARFVTVELDEERAVLTQKIFSYYPNVQVRQGDWHLILEHGPFDLLFADGGKAKEREPELVLDAMAAGGIVVLDDLTPEELWTEEQKILWPIDPTRNFWLNNPRVVATELLVTPQNAVIIATKL